MTAIEYLDRPAPGWFALDVMRKGNGRKWDRVALMVDVDPEELKHCRTARAAWVRVPGKHRNHEAAWDAFHDMMATRH
jgi:hypothetical protein